MKETTWLGALLVLGIVVVLAGCGKKDTPPPPSFTISPPSPPPPATDSSAEKPETDAKADEDDSDDPWFGEKKTVTGAIGKSLLRGLTGGEGGAKKDDVPKFIK